MKSLLILAFIIILLSPGCKKEPKRTTPSPSNPSNSTVPDTSANKQFKTSRTISFAALLVSDVEMIASYLLEKRLMDGFFLSSSNSGTVQTLYDADSKIAMISFDSTKCRDGKIRNGSILCAFNVEGSSPSAVLSHDHQFIAEITLMDYSIDGYKIRLISSNAVLKNTRDANFDPANDKLTWEFWGNFHIIHPTDPTQNVRWQGVLTKTLQNTADPTVWPSPNESINWNKSKVAYSGSVSGSAFNYPYTFYMSDTRPLLRDFNCSLSFPDAQITEYHPFVAGQVDFVSENDLEPKVIDYGADNVCDNIGKIRYKGYQYGISFYQ